MRHDRTISRAATEGGPVALEAPAAAKGRAGLTLRRYRVTNFRSVTDSGWLDLDRVTALIGVNDPGKTNLLLPLWKLNPAGDGAVSTMAGAVLPILSFGVSNQNSMADPRLIHARQPSVHN